ncbi:hypothetical protein Dsin_007513 [Dipteronia sinensis]|uniref:Uncharacterized protein n=1 Tax=Dipteronia sinensis TaxID=43782 RepID=A0AAE0B0A5_9ROSI|nr:hypothetical protein Dsin_007513 [Dipteronia sinensis]
MPLECRTVALGSSEHHIFCFINFNRKLIATACIWMNWDKPDDPLPVDPDESVAFSHSPYLTLQTLLFLICLLQTHQISSFLHIFNSAVRRPVNDRPPPPSTVRKAGKVIGLLHEGRRYFDIREAVGPLQH